jgi:hypothetical protein
VLLSLTFDHNGCIPNAVVVEVLERTALAVGEWVQELSSRLPTFRVASPHEPGRLATATDATQTEIPALVQQLDAVDPAQSYASAVLQHDPALASSKASEECL